MTSYLEELDAALTPFFKVQEDGTEPEFESLQAMYDHERGLPRDEFKRRALADTGFLARNVLGYDYYKNDDNRDLIRPGGLIPYGPMGEFGKFIDSKDRFKLALCPRATMKTTWGSAWLTRQILNDRNVRCIVGMENDKMGHETIDIVRQPFEDPDSKLCEIFGDDWVGKPWKSDGFTVNGRTLNVRGRTVWTCGVGTKTQGMRPDVIWVDDPTSWQQVNQAEQVEKCKAWFSFLMFLGDGGYEVLATMTPYDLGDLSFHIREELKETFKVFEIPCGMMAVNDGKGGFGLEGEPRWAHLTKSRLKNLYSTTLKTPHNFNAQMALTVTSPDEAVFQRSYFKETFFDPDHHGYLNAYVLVDTASSDKDAACFSVVALGTLDWEDTFDLIDLRIGKWKPALVKETILNVMEQWQSKLRICGVVAEAVSYTQVYGDWLQEESKRRGINFRAIQVALGRNDQAKNERIRGSQNRFVAGKFRICSDTVPRMYEDVGRTKILWNPQGHREGVNLLPAGELVNQYINFKWSGKGSYAKDIPDAIAMLDLKASGRKRGQVGPRYVLPSPRPQHTQRPEAPRDGTEMRERVTGHTVPRYRRGVNENYARSLANRIRR